MGRRQDKEEEGKEEEEEKENEWSRREGSTNAPRIVL